MEGRRGREVIWERKVSWVLQRGGSPDHGEVEERAGEREPCTGDHTRKTLPLNH